jgi:hypothetical protein
MWPTRRTAAWALREADDSGAVFTAELRVQKAFARAAGTPAKEIDCGATRVTLSGYVAFNTAIIADSH